MTSSEDSSASPQQTEDSGSDYELAYERTDFGASREGSSGLRKHQKPCRYYNHGFCRDGKRCTYLHVCKYYFKGRCRNGDDCSFSHRNVSESASSATRLKTKTKTEGINSERSSNKQYQWQLKKNEWMNIEHDSIIETHYSLPWAKSIKLFNTPYGKLFIDFNKMEIRNKRLQVRRQSFETSESENVWCWYYYRSKQWTEYGKKDLQGKRIPVQSAAIERKYQKNKKGAFRFEARHSSYKISFQEMTQTNTKTGSKRKVRRRPKLLATPVQSLSTMFAHFHVAPLSTATTPRSAVWQFEGNTGKWYNFKHRSGTNTECSISNSDIEIKYQGNPASTLTFTVGGFQYKLDFSAMQQTNLTTGTTRRIRRVES